MKNDFNKAFHCGCCEEIYPVLHKHTHHKTPKALGGKDTPDNLIDLCPGCHDALHNLAYKLMTHQYGQAKVIDSLTLIYKDNAKAKQTCLDLATQVRNAMVTHRERGMAPNELINITTVLRKQHKALVEMRCKELKVSQEAYIRGLILNDVGKRFHAMPINNAEETKVIKALKKRI